MANEVLNPTRKKELTKELWGLSYPTIIAFSLQGFYDIIDMIWVGRISKEAMAGVTLFTLIYMLFGVLNEIAGASSVSMISQSYGRGTPARTQKIAEQTISFKVILAIISGVLLFIFLRPILNLYSDDPAVIEAALDYGIVRIFALPLAFSSYSVNTIFRCTGDSKTPMTIMVVATIANLILDPILMFETIPWTNLPGLGLGVYGAGLATVISIAVSFLLGFFILLTGRRDVTISIKGLFTLDKDIDLQLLSIGLPSGFQLFVRQGFNAILMWFITAYGTTAVTVMGIGSKIIGFSFMPIAGFTFAGSTLVGHSLGRENDNEAEFIALRATTFITAIVSTLSLVAMIFPKSLLSVFNDDPEVLESGVPMMRWIAVAVIVVALAAGMRVVFSGSGFNRPFLVSTLVSRWFVHLPVMFLLVNILKVPLNTVWISFVIAELADLAITYYYYRRGDWRRMRV